MGKLKLVLVTFFILAHGLTFGQKNADSSSAEIRQQAIEMREMLDKYLADKLKHPTTKKEVKVNDSSIAVLIKQFNDKLAEHEKAIQELKDQMARLESGTPATTQKNVTPLHGMPAKKMALPTEQPNAYTLILYFDFDSFALTQEQKNALWQFTRNKNYKICNVHAYTDWYGTEKHNKYLALNRCDEVVKNIKNTSYQIRKGKFINCGSTEPVKISHAATCRRVEVILK